MKNVTSLASLRPALTRAAAFGLLWWVLAEGSSDGWMLGTVATVLATWVSLVLLPPEKITVSLSGLFRFLVFFVWHSVRGGVQVAWMAMRGRDSLQPGLLEVPVALLPGAPQVLLVNALGLMPGTAGVEITDQKLLIHVLDERLPILAEIRALEAIIGRLFGVPE
jgi:multicomponent Na+:H+ antiporter subunit E